jgi:uncharacterized membrane protein
MTDPIADAANPTPTPNPTPNPAPNPAPGGFDMNRPTIICLLYLSGFVFGITGLVGGILAFVWRGDQHEPWEASHYQYLINTFWIGLVGSVIGVVLTLVLIGVIILLAVAALVLVRSVLSLVNAQRHQPMPNPGTWLA